MLYEGDLRNHSNCMYCNMDSLPDYNANNSITMTHFNVGSLPAHFEEIETLLVHISNPPNVGLVVTWLRIEIKNLCSFIGFNAYYQSIQKWGRSSHLC